MAWLFIVIRLRRRVAALVAEFPNALRGALPGWQRAVWPSIGVTVGRGLR
jgi:hypothetical protein